MSAMTPRAWHPAWQITLDGLRACERTLTGVHQQMVQRVITALEQRDIEPDPKDLAAAMMALADRAIRHEVRANTWQAEAMRLRKLKLPKIKPAPAPPPPPSPPPGPFQNPIESALDRLRHITSDANGRRSLEKKK